MNHYGISAIHWNAILSDIDEVLLHKFVRPEPDGAPIIERGERTSCSDVVSLMRAGDTVWVLRSAGGGRYKNTDHVGVNAKRGRQTDLYSCMRDGTPTTALADLPRYQKPEDLPPKPPGVDRPDTRL